LFGSVVNKYVVSHEAKWTIKTKQEVLEPSYFGSHLYSSEKLVAECGLAFQCAHSGIERRTIESSAAYIYGWSKALKTDKKMLVMAAAQAQKASDYILNKKEGEEEVPEDTTA